MSKKLNLDQLGQKIKTELGIDVHKYKNEEAVEDFANLLAFPQYFTTWVIRPIFFFLLLFVLGFFVLDLQHIEYLIYGVVGFFLFFVLGGLLGINLLVYNIRTDFNNIGHYILEMMKLALNDLGQVQAQFTPENRKNALGLLFKGIIHIVTLPALSQVISNKIPFWGAGLNRMVTKVFTLIAERAHFDEDASTEKMHQKPSAQPNNEVNDYIASIRRFSDQFQSLLTSTFKIVSFPFKVMLLITFICWVLFLYLLH